MWRGATQDDTFNLRFHVSAATRACFTAFCSVSAGSPRSKTICAVGTASEFCATLVTCMRAQGKPLDSPTPCSIQATYLLSGEKPTTSTGWVAAAASRRAINMATFLSDEAPEGTGIWIQVPGMTYIAPRVL